MNVNNIIRILIVDDSAFTRESLAYMLSSDPELLIVGQAKNGTQAVEMVNVLKPDLVIMDIQMPVMNGFEATEKIMANHPVPIVIYTSAIEGEEFVFKALELGALSVIKKETNLLELNTDFVNKIKLLSKTKVITHLRGKKKNRSREPGRLLTRNIKRGQVVGIVCSTGGPNALKNILSGLPKNFPAGLMIVQHLANGFEMELISWLNKTSNIEVRPAMNGKRVKPGIAYMAVSDHHLVVKEGGIMELIDSEPVWSLKPAGDILLSSLSRVYGSKAIGVILTGMGRDGAEGMRQIKMAGGRTIAQDETTSVIFGMPGSAIEMGVIDRIAPLNLISNELIRGLQQA